MFDLQDGPRHPDLDNVQYQHGIIDQVRGHLTHGRLLGIHHESSPRSRSIGALGALISVRTSLVEFSLLSRPQV